MTHKIQLCHLPHYYSENYMGLDVSAFDCLEGEN
jgi:hypothetical protein